MLSIHYVSIMMRIFYIDWQQHWECDRTMNIDDQQNSHKWQTSVDQLTVGLPVTSERCWASFQVTRLFHKSNCFTLRPFFAATYVFVVWNFTRLITRLKSCDQAALQMVFSVCPSVSLSHLFDYIPIMVSSWNFQELLPMTKVRSMQKFKVRGQRSRLQRSQANLTVSGL